MSVETEWECLTLQIGGNPDEYCCFLEEMNAGGTWAKTLRQSRSWPPHSQWPDSCLQAFSWPVARQSPIGWHLQEGPLEALTSQVLTPFPKQPHSLICALTMGLCHNQKPASWFQTFCCHRLFYPSDNLLLHPNAIIHWNSLEVLFNWIHPLPHPSVLSCIYLLPLIQAYSVVYPILHWALIFLAHSSTSYAYEQNASCWRQLSTLSRWLLSVFHFELEPWTSVTEHRGIWLFSSTFQKDSFIFFSLFPNHTSLFFSFATSHTLPDSFAGSWCSSYFMFIGESVLGPSSVLYIAASHYVSSSTLTQPCTTLLTSPPCTTALSSRSACPPASLRLLAGPVLSRRWLLKPLEDSTASSHLSWTPWNLTGTSRILSSSNSTWMVPGTTRGWILAASMLIRWVMSYQLLNILTVILDYGQLLRSTKRISPFSLSSKPGWFSPVFWLLS